MLTRDSGSSVLEETYQLEMVLRANVKLRGSILSLQVQNNQLMLLINQLPAWNHLNGFTRRLTDLH